MTGHAIDTTLFASFDRIDIINLPARTDRKREMIRELRKVGLADDPRVNFFPAVTIADKGVFSSRGGYGNFLSFAALLQDAAAHRQSILILEDDCDFILPDILEYRMPRGCDVFYGGYKASNPADLHGSDIIGSHFMGFSSRAATAAAAYFTGYLKPDFVPDARATADNNFDPAVRPSTDGAFVWFRRAHPELSTVFAMLGVQRPSRTDIGDTPFFDRIIGLRELAGLARRGRRRFFGKSASMKKADFNHSRD